MGVSMENNFLVWNIIIVHGSNFLTSSRSRKIVNLAQSSGHDHVFVVNDVLALNNRILLLVLNAEY